LAQKSVFTATAIQIVTPQGKTTLTKSDTPKTVGIILWGTSAVALVDGTEDTVIQTSDGWTITIQEELADFMTALSATSITGS